MTQAKGKALNWDGKSRVSNDVYRKRFDEIFKKEKTLHEGYLYLREATYTQPGINRNPVKKTLEYFGRGDSVAALIFDKDRNQFVLVR